MQTFFYLLFIVLLLFILYDAFITIISTRGAGPFTGFWTDRLWKLLLFVHNRRPIHGVLALAGPFMLLLTILLWYFLHAVCWFVLFALQAHAVVQDPLDSPASLSEIMYFISSTVSSLGYGDFVPDGPPWTVYAGLMALTSTIILTTSLSYILAALNAVIESRAIAKGLFGIGTTLEEFTRNAWLDERPESLQIHLLNLSSAIEQSALKRYSYPVMQYFHANSVQMASPRAILLLADSLFLISQVSPDGSRPPQAVLTIIQRSIDTHLQITLQLKGSEDSGNSHNPGEIPSRQLLQAMGLEASDEANFARALDTYGERRSKLLQLCREAGWTVEEQASS